MQYIYDITIHYILLYISVQKVCFLSVDRDFAINMAMIAQNIGGSDYKS